MPYATFYWEIIPIYIVSFTSYSGVLVKLLLLTITKFDVKNLYTITPSNGDGEKRITKS